MAEENEVVETEETTIQESPLEETNETADEVDYNAEFDAAVESFDRAEKNREGYLKRKGTETEEELDIDSKVDEAIKRALPKLQSSLVEDNIENALNELSQGNEAKKKLIRFHFENSVSSNGTIRERMENALLIAEKKTILKTQKEMAVALHNRQGLSTTGQGSSTEGVEVKDAFFSKEQLQSLKAKGWDDKKIQKLKDNMRK